MLYILLNRDINKKESFRKSKDGSLLEKEYKITSPNLSKTQAEIKTLINIMNLLITLLEKI